MEKTEYLENIKLIVSRTKKRAEGLQPDADLLAAMAAGKEIADNVRSNAHLDNTEAALALEYYTFILASAFESAASIVVEGIAAANLFAVIDLLEV